MRLIARLPRTDRGRRISRCGILALMIDEPGPLPEQNLRRYVGVWWTRRWVGLQVWRWYGQLGPT